MTSVGETDEFDLRGGGRYTVVVGQEPLGLPCQCVADPAIYLVRGLQKRADVELEKPGAVLLVDVGVHPAGYRCEVRGVVGVDRTGRQAWQRPVAFREVDRYRFTTVARRLQAEQTGDVPDGTADLQPVAFLRFDVFDGSERVSDEDHSDATDTGGNEVYVPSHVVCVR